MIRKFGGSSGVENQPQGIDIGVGELNTLPQFVLPADTTLRISHIDALEKKIYCYATSSVNAYVYDFSGNLLRTITAPFVIYGFSKHGILCLSSGSSPYAYTHYDLNLNVIRVISGLTNLYSSFLYNKKDNLYTGTFISSVTVYREHDVSGTQVRSLSYSTSGIASHFITTFKDGVVMVSNTYSSTWIFVINRTAGTITYKQIRTMELVAYYFETIQGVIG